MANVEYSVDGDTLTITVDLSQNLGPSNSGKTDVVGSTNGFVQVAPDITMSLNVVKKPAK